MLLNNDQVKALMPHRDPFLFIDWVESVRLPGVCEKPGEKFFDIKEMVGVEMISQGMNADPASVAFDTLKSAISKKADVAIIDTAGRLHNKIGLMNELSKIYNVMKKVVPDAPHEVLLVLDASTGQNAIEQAKQFTAATNVNSLALTKLDGTAKGGVVIGISDQFKIPVRYIGLGEKMEDLQLFNRKTFVDSLFE
jgi:fused signal recognition particle receptor